MIFCQIISFEPWAMFRLGSDLPVEADDGIQFAWSDRWNFTVGQHHYSVLLGFVAELDNYLTFMHIGFVGFIV